MGLDRPIELPRGAMDDCRRGEDPRAVFIGDRDFGGGRWVRLLRMIAADVVIAGIEPGKWHVSAYPIEGQAQSRKPCVAVSRTLLDIHRFRACHCAAALRW